jgi:hypothetical protein
MLHLRPAFASLATGSVNFPVIVDENPPHFVRHLAATMLEQGIKPEIEAFDLVMHHNTTDLMAVARAGGAGNAKLLAYAPQAGTTAFHPACSCPMGQDATLRWPADNCRCTGCRTTGNRRLGDAGSDIDGRECADGPDRGARRDAGRRGGAGGPGGGGQSARRAARFRCGDGSLQKKLLEVGRPCRWMSMCGHPVRWPA